METLYTPKYPLHTLSHALDILYTLKDCPSSDGMTLNALSQQLCMSKSSVHRILDTLLAYRFVEKTPGVIPSYRLSWGAYQVGFSVPKYHTLNTADYSSMLEKLSHQLQAPTTLSILSQYNSVVICSIAPPGEKHSAALIRMGEHLPLYATASGKLFMLDFTADEIQKYFKTITIKKYTSNTILNYIDFLDELNRIKAQNYSASHQEYLEQVSYVAMPVRDYTKKVVAAISVAITPEEMETQAFTESLTALEDCCRQLSSYLGYQ